MFVYLINALGVLSGPVTLPQIPGFGVQLPSNAIELPEELPALASGWVWVFSGEQLVQLEDLRGDYFSTVDGSPVEHVELGGLPQGLTPIARPSPFHTWVAGTWQLDSAAQNEAARLTALRLRDQYLVDASTRIAPLQYAEDLGEATELERVALLDWKRYSIALNRITQQPGYPAVIEWPPAPATPQ